MSSEPPSEPVDTKTKIKSTPPPEEEGDTLDENLFAETSDAPPVTNK